MNKCTSNLILWTNAIKVAVFIHIIFVFYFLGCQFVGDRTAQAGTPNIFSICTQSHWIGLFLFMYMYITTELIFRKQMEFLQQ